MNAQQPPLKTSYSFTDCLTWTLFFAIPVLIAVFATARASVLWMLLYLIVFALCLLGIGCRFFCTHCPHYNNSNGKTRCIFLWHMPAFFKPRPGPLHFYDKILTALGFIIAVAFPVYWLLAYPLLLLAYLIAWALIGVFLKRYECNRCINRNCPLNAAPPDEAAAGTSATGSSGGSAE